MTDHFWQTGRYLSDGGLETDLIFNRGVDLPEFASFPLLDDDHGRDLLRSYYDGYAALAAKAGVGLTMESPTWRANPDWGRTLGYDEADLTRLNRAAVELLQQQRETYRDLADVRIIGAVGPRADGYVAGDHVSADDHAEHHSGQVAALAQAGADVVAAYTMTTADEGIGIVRAARQAGVPVLIGLTVETDGTMPDGTALADAVARIEQQASPDGFVVNCAHPTHIAPGLAAGAWLDRVVQVNPNASTMSHAELDQAEALDIGDIDLLATSFEDLQAQLPSLSIVGGCCGTDTRHVAALWGL